MIVLQRRKMRVASIHAALVLGESMCLTYPLFLSDDNILGGPLGELARPRDYHGWCWYEI
jgi:hypothetical protein